MGCGAKAKPKLFRLQPHGKTATPPKGALSGLWYADVSDWQGHPSWGSVAAWQRSRGWSPYTIYKMGEYSLDPDALYNAQQTRANGVRAAGYWFIRPVGCSRESANIKWAAAYLGLKVVVLDEEVPGIAGYAECLTPTLKAAGLVVAIYSSPGSWGSIGGSSAGLPVWVAAYGPSNPPCLFTCNVGGSGQSILAWQFTDGVYGTVVNIPGIGRGDVSVSYGIDRLGAAPAPQPKPKPKPKPPKSNVFSIFPTLKLATPHGSWSERQLAESIDGALQHKAKFAGYLRDVLDPTALWFAHRIDYLAFHVWSPPSPNWAANHGGSRRLYLIHAAAGQRIG